ncbi:MAG: hypothetical protein ACOYK5_02685 [Bacteroidia bacterium]|jgi:hypothetical protein
MNLPLQRFHLLFLLFSFGVLGAQGSLQFNQALLLDNSNSPYTVPAGKVWKITQNSYGTRHFLSSTSTFTANWSGTTPNPCSGSTSGSTLATAINFSSCGGVLAPTANGHQLGQGSGLITWLPAGTIVDVPASPCVHTASVNVGQNAVTRDNRTSAFLCQPIQISAGSTVPNSNILSIIEFNIIP